MFYHSTTVGPSVAAIKLALRKAFSLSSETCLAIPELRSLDGALGEVLGERAVKFLKKNHKAEYFGKPLRITTQKIDAGVLYGPILAAYLPLAQLDDLLQKYPKQDLVYLAASQSDLDAHLAKYPSRFI